MRILPANMWIGWELIYGTTYRNPPFNSFARTQLNRYYGYLWMRLGQLDHHVIHLIWMHECIRILQLISVARRTTHEATLHQGFDPATWRSLGWTAPLLCGSPCIIGDFNPKNSPGKGLTPHSNPSKPNKKPSIHPTSVLGLNGRITLKRTPVAHRASRGPDRHATQGQHAA